MLCFACAAAPVRPQYVNTEPTTEQIPEVDIALALQRLQRSRLYWKLSAKEEQSVGLRFGDAAKLKSPNYSYVRAVQVATDLVEVTYVVIEGGRVVIRGLGTYVPSLKFRPNTKIPREPVPTPRQSWVELGAQVGIHDEGALALTIPELYDRCEAEILRPGAGPIRLYFHPTGVLMHCGRTKAACPDCETVSIHAYSVQSIGHWAATLDVSQWACSEPWGLVLLGAKSWLHGTKVRCAPPALPAKSVMPRQDDLGVDICKIDPSACPSGIKVPTISSYYSGFEFDFTLLCALGYLNVGKADPDDTLAVIPKRREIRPVKPGETSVLRVGFWPELLERANSQRSPQPTAVPATNED